MNINESFYKISEMNLVHETDCIKGLSSSIEHIDFSPVRVSTLELLNKLKKKQSSSILETLISRFGINTKEGLGLMELAEALLRVPDGRTSYDLITDKLAYDKSWRKYKDKSNPWIVNNLIGHLITASKILKHKNDGILHKTIAMAALPIINKAARYGVTKIGKQFIMGSDTLSALQASKNYKKYLFSYDILGEGARSQEQADFYFNSYMNAIEAVAGVIDTSVPLRKRISLSIKLSALHAKYEATNLEALMIELVPKIKAIVVAGSKAGVNITIDAEECARLSVSLIIFKTIFLDPDLAAYQGFGLAVQAYNKSAMHVLKFLSQLAQIAHKEIPVRLVKGAYWDSEIKKAQVLGLSNFHVYTQKVHTDISYLACANFMLGQRYFYPQFAGHNAYTVSAILHLLKLHNKLSDTQSYEFQRLHGMGIALHDDLIKNGYESRIYAPIGPYQDLLAYLVRRILENGASTSFVHLFAGAHLGVDNEFDALAQNPIEVARNRNFEANSKIVLPLNIYNNRINSLGMDMGNILDLEKLQESLKHFKDKTWRASPIIEGKTIDDRDADRCTSPAFFSHLIGHLINANTDDCEAAMKSLKAYYPVWSKTSVDERIAIANKFADLMEHHRNEIATLIMLEVGKNFSDCEGELRETVDFCRYYALSAKRLIGEKLILDTHHVGEYNELTFVPRGIFVCISPWNFPLAIFVGPIISALLCGNCVAAKPAESTPLVASFAIKLLLEAGLKKHSHALAFLPGTGSTIGNYLTSHKDIAGVSFTGSTVTAKIIESNINKNHAAILPIIAETAGQNAMIVDSSALAEQAIDDIVISAFGSTGQRCSALRVLYLQEEIADKFIELIKGATDSKKIGYAFEDLSVDAGPVINIDAFTKLTEYKKKMSDKLLYEYKLSDSVANKGFYIAPAMYKIDSIRQLGGEVFGPILHVVIYKSNELDKIIDDINSTGYGLTFGMESRIESKYRDVANRIHAGNIYINRSMIGAVVGVQPFGGVGLSGTGFKAGGPNYLMRFLSEKSYTVNTAAARGATEILA